jgi:hypothetical protein
MTKTLKNGDSSFVSSDASFSPGPDFEARMNMLHALFANLGSEGHWQLIDLV